VSATLVRAFLLAQTLNNNGDAAAICACIADCGKAHGVFVLVAEPDEGVVCECADAPLAGPNGRK
jgi:hypothetical protein